MGSMLGLIAGQAVGITQSVGASPGASVAFGVEAALGEEAGGTIGLSWSVYKGMSGAQNAIPGISTAFSPGRAVGRLQRRLDTARREVLTRARNPNAPSSHSAQVAGSGTAVVKSPVVRRSKPICGAKSAPLPGRLMRTS